MIFYNHNGWTPTGPPPSAQRVRDTEDLPKIAELVRQMAKVPDCKYGEKAQVKVFICHGVP